MSDLASVHLDVQTGARREPAAPLPDDPFRIALVGDFTGRAGRDAPPLPPLAERRTVAVDRDDLDAVLASMRPGLSLALEDGTRVDLSFDELEDFHPDRIFERAPFFQSLREARRRLADPGSFRDTLDSILATSSPQDTPSASDAAEDVVADVLGGGPSLLDRMVGGDRAAAADPLRSWLRRIVAPHVLPGEDPARDALLSDLDDSIADGLRRVLHHPSFRALEALWRGVDFMVRRMETGTSLKLLLFDATRAEIAADLGAQRDPAESQLARALRGAWSLVLVDASIAGADDDVAFARDLAAFGCALGAPVIAGAGASLVGLPAFEGLPDASDVRPWEDDGWHALRRSADAAWLGLVLPRLLLRVPYGVEGEPLERLDFEELGQPPGHEEFLWGNGAFAAGVLLAEAFTAHGWRMRPGSQEDVTGLPIYTWKGPDGPEIVPCAESLMSDRLADAIMEAGPMVLATIRHGDRARLVRFQSIASPLRALQGPWTRAG